MLVKGLLVTWATTSSATMQLTFFPEYHSFSRRKVNTMLISGVLHTLKAKFLGPTWGPSVANRTQVGSMLAPWTLLSEYMQLSSMGVCIGSHVIQYTCIHDLCSWLFLLHSQYYWLLLPTNNGCTVRIPSLLGSLLLHYVERYLSSLNANQTHRFCSSIYSALYEWKWQWFGNKYIQAYCISADFQLCTILWDISDDMLPLS